MELGALLNKVKQQLRPDFSILKDIQEFLDKLNTKLATNSMDATAVAGGSVAKGTFLKNDYDVDIFVRFAKPYAPKNIANLLGKVLPRSAERVHGSRDYFHLKHKKLTFELVPVLAVSTPEEARNVTDMSPLHVAWVQQKTKKKPSLKDDIRLAKQFCKAAKVYGAESYIQGFSGHILDILVIHYGSFLHLLKAAVKWKPKVVIDTEKHLKRPLQQLDPAKTFGPLIVVDPLQKDRNAAAALHQEKFDRFVEAAKAFLEHPDETFFVVWPLDKKSIQNIHRLKYPDEECFMLELHPTKGTPDVAGSKIKKALTFIEVRLRSYGFAVLETDWEYGQPSYAYFVLKQETLSETVELKGPPVNQKDHAAKFKKKHRTTYTKNGFWYATEKRPYRKAKDAFKDLLKDTYVKERIKTVKLLR